MGSDDVAAMASKIEQIVRKQGWESDSAAASSLQRILGKLTAAKVDQDLLRTTRVGKLVHKAGCTPKIAPSKSPPSSSPTRGMNLSQGGAKLEEARQKLKLKYDEERDKKASRKVQVLANPRIKGRKPAKVSVKAGPRTLKSRSSAPARVSVNVPRMLSSTPTSTQKMDPRDRMLAERHARRQQVLQRARQEASGGKEPSKSRAPERSKSVPPSSQRPDSRKAMLDKLYPRICGATTESAPATASKSSSKKSKKSATYTSGQREVLEWLRSLPVDMSEYAPAFFENGFDSMQLLTTIETTDLPSLVPKKGHHRLIQQGLSDLKKKRKTSAKKNVKRSASEPRKRKRSTYDDYEDYESDDSFVVDDMDGGYRPGAITKMFQKGRRKPMYDSDGSSDMETSYADIQREEMRSSKVGEFEDYQEELRNKKLAKRKK